MNNLIPQKHYKEFLNQLIASIKNSQYKAYQAVNRHLVDMYWTIGKQLHDKIEVAKWGEGVVEKLSLDLQREFPAIKGFSERNLWNMKKHYGFYSVNIKLQPLAAEISWTNNDEIVKLATVKSTRAKVATYEIIDQKLLERKIHSLPLPTKAGKLPTVS